MYYAIGFILGFITAIAMAGLVFTILAFFRAGIEKRVKIIETVLARAGPKVHGAIFVPDEDEDDRQEIIKRNSAQGKSTTLQELSDL